MPPQPQDLPTGASSTIAEPSDVLVGLDIEAIFFGEDEPAAEANIKKFREAAKRLGVNVTERHLLDIMRTLAHHIGRRIILQLTPELRDELKALDKTKPEPEERHLWLIRNVPNLNVIYAEEIRGALQYLQSLKNRPDDAIDKSSMAVDTQRTIEQTQAAAQPAEVLTHPGPDTLESLGAIATEAVQLNDAAARLRELDLPAAASTETEVAISGLRALGNHSNQAAWDIGVRAVKQGAMSQARFAKLFGISKANMSRRLSGEAESPEEPEE